MKKDKIIQAIDKVLEWLLYILLLTLPFAKSIIEICIGVGIALVVVKKILLKDFRLPSTPGNMPLLFVFLTAAISLVNSDFMGLSLRALFSKNLKFICLYFLVVEAIDSRVKMMNVLKIGLISAVIVFSDSLIQYFITYRDLLHDYPAFKYYFNYDAVTHKLAYCFTVYPTGPFPFPNDLSSWLIVVIPVILFVSIFGVKNIWSKVSLIAVSLVGIYVFVLAKARGAWLAFFLAMFSLIFLVKKKKVLLLILAVMCILMVVCFFNSAYNIFNFTSLIARGDMWTNGVKIYMEHPVIGNGINTFFNKYRYVRQDADKGMGSYAHNCYLQMAADTGILGLSAFLWFVFSILKNAVSYIRSAADGFYRSVALGSLVGITAFLLHAVVDTNLYSLNLAALFWFSAGFIVAVVKLGKLKAV